MRRMRRLFLLISLCFLFVGCSQGVVEEKVSTEGNPAWMKWKDEPITFDWYINYSWYKTPWGQNEVSKAISNETGVSVNFLVPTGSEKQKLNTMIASNTLPDFITLGWWEAQAQAMVNNDMVYALNELADQYDTYFYQVTDEQVINWYTKEDGNIYSYPNSTYTPKDLERGLSGASNQNFLVRKDIYEAIGKPDMTTPEGFTEAVLKAKEMFPMVEDKQLIPIGADEFTIGGCNSFDKYLQNFLAVPHEVEGRYHDRYLDPEYIRWLKVFRKLNEEGCLSEEIFIDKRAQLEEKLADGRYFCLLYQGTDIQTPQKILNAKNPEQIYIAVDGPKNANGDNLVLPSTGINGWTITLISKNCKNPERAIAFMSYLLSEEGQKKTFLGVEGITYEVVDGEYVINSEIQQLLDSNREEYDAVYGADNAYWMLQNNVMQDNWLIKKDYLISPLKDWTMPYTKYTAQYEIVFDADSPYANISDKIERDWGKTLPLLLLADSEDEFEKLLEEHRERKYALGYEELQKQCTIRMIEAKEKLGLE